jgi:hypothetical protein
MEIEELIEYPHFAELERKFAAARLRKWLGLLNTIFLTPAGVFAMWLSFNGFRGLEWIGIPFTLGGVASFFIYRSAAISLRTVVLDINMKTSEHFEKEHVRLSGLRESISLAEWENYKLQLQNNRLLKELKSRPRSSQTTTTTTGWVTEIGD